MSEMGLALVAVLQVGIGLQSVMLLSQDLAEWVADCDRNPPGNGGSGRRREWWTGLEETVPLIRPA